MKIAFLCLLIHGFYHEHIWHAFFKGSEHKYSLYAHAKYEIPHDSIAASAIRVPNRETHWAITIDAQIELWKAALQDPDNTKFVIISESHIPLQDFDTVYEQIMKTDASIFTFEHNFHLNPDHAAYDPRRLIPGIPLEYQYKQTQWGVYNRKHAQLLVDARAHMQLPALFDQEHYPGTVLSCAQELDNVLQRETCYACWDHPRVTPYEHPLTFINLQDQVEYALLADAIKQGYLFARKISKGCNVAPIMPLLNYVQ